MNAASEGFAHPRHLVHDSYTHLQRQARTIILACENAKEAFGNRDNEEMACLAKEILRSANILLEMAQSVCGDLE